MCHILRLGLVTTRTMGGMGKMQLARVVQELGSLEQIELFLS